MLLSESHQWSRVPCRTPQDRSFHRWPSMSSPRLAFLHRLLETASPGLGDVGTFLDPGRLGVPRMGLVNAAKRRRSGVVSVAGAFRLRGVELDPSPVPDTRLRRQRAEENVAPSGEC